MTDKNAELLNGLVTDLYIGGKAVPAAGGRRFDVMDPATGLTITTVADASVKDAIAAIDAADEAAPAWAATAPPPPRRDLAARVRPDDGWRRGPRAADLP